MNKQIFFSPKTGDGGSGTPSGGGGDPHSRFVTVNHKVYGKIKVPVMTQYKGKSKRSKDQPVPAKCTFKVAEITHEDGSVFLAAYDIQPK